MKYIQRIIYFVAGANLAWGTWEFVNRMFLDGSGWHYAIVAIVGIELVFLLLVMAAKRGTHSPRWSLVPLALSAVIQAAKVSGDIAGKEFWTAVVMVVISVVSLLALACVVYLFELRPEGAEKATQQGHSGPDAAEVAERAVKGAIDALRAEFAQSQEVYERRVTDLQAMHEQELAEARSGLQVLDRKIAMLETASPVLAEPLQIAGPDASLQVAIAELQGTLLAQAVPALVDRGFTKAAIAAALGKQPYQISPGRIKADEVLQ